MAWEFQRALGSSHIAPCRECGRIEFQPLHLQRYQKTWEHCSYDAKRTVDTLAKFDDLPQRHRFTILRSKMGQDTGTKGDLLVQIALSEAISAEFELGRSCIAKICIHNAQWVQFSDMVTSHLVSTDEQLDLA